MRRWVLLCIVLAVALALSVTGLSATSGNKIGFSVYDMQFGLFKQKIGRAHV